MAIYGKMEDDWLVIEYPASDDYKTRIHRFWTTDRGRLTRVTEKELVMCAVLACPWHYQASRGCLRD